MKHFTITFRPDGKRVSIHEGATLLEAAGQAGIILNTVCGGKGICRKCVVKLEPSGQEVLACQYRIQSDLIATVPPTSRFFKQKILEHGVGSYAQFQPDVYRKYLKSPTDSTERIFGVAVDIGTTTVVAKLVNMTNGQCVATEATLNPQICYGDDVISRITYGQTETKLAHLHQTIINCINELITRLCAQASIDVLDIYEMCAVGNTTMNHIFLKLPIVQLGQAPYHAFSLDARDIPPAELALQMNPSGNVYTPANIAGFVGSDTTAVGLAVNIMSAEEVTLAIDIGTNGEVILGTKDKLYSASCAAGPALEGARIEQGSRAVEGAIEAVVINEDDIDVDVIGGKEPRSICGSGLIDAVAVLLDLGIVDASGRFVERKELAKKLPPRILARMMEHNGQPAFCLCRDRDDKGPNVLLTQKDIREVQLAKGAIRTGIKLLQKKLGLGDCDVKAVLLAGAFGNYIRKESALRIGLLPKVQLEQIHFVGNAAGSGAEMMLLSSRLRASAAELARKIEYVEIAHEKDFSSIFAESMLF